MFLPLFWTNFKHQFKMSYNRHVSVQRFSFSICQIITLLECDTKIELSSRIVCINIEKFVLFLL